jgi:ATP-dependent DNA helicase RecG
MTLQSPLEFVKGVGPQTAKRFAEAGLNTVADILNYFPRRYDDFSNIIPIATIQPGNITIKATVESVAGRYVRRGLHITEAVLDDGSAKTRAVWFNQPYRADQVKKGETFYFSGSYELQRSRYVLSNPSAEKEADFTVSTGRIVPIYPEFKQLKSLQIRRVLRELLPLMQFVPETLPTTAIESEKLLPYGAALRQIHFPESTELLEKAKNRFAFEELLELLLASLLNRHENASLKGYRISFQKEVAQQFIRALPFVLTSAQKRAAWEILQDFEQGQPMNRLLQGDVGSGKTVVAAMVSYMAVTQGFQIAIMAPTEILAIQHAETLAKLLEPLGVRLGLLLGSLKPKNKTLIQQKIADNELDIVVGTHALIQKDTKFARLGLVVIDEQHRFGVEQRAELLKKSQHMPHLLSMTATPIPRSLQLTVYGELEVSIIDELPAGRRPIVTRLESTYARRQVYAAIDQEIGKGRQVYVVCPVIADGAQAELKSVESEYVHLKDGIFKHRRLGLLHGQLKADEKESVMRRFKAGEYDMLVATSVIEVGVDVPNATIMVIEGAERFGLAQLHQLRGRVGRGAEQSYCYLIPSSGKRPSERLLELEQSQDGFYLAEVDLRLRGPGEIYGRMQHGQLNLRIANLADTKLIKRVRTAAQLLLDSGQDLLQYKQLYQRVSHYRRLTSLN